jgi:hypothetical protein
MISKQNLRPEILGAGPGILISGAIFVGSGWSCSRGVFSLAYCFLYMFQMKSNGESDENVLYLLTSNIAEALIISPCAAAKVHALQGLPKCWGFCRVTR